jgi:hypothetical protein
MCGRFIGALPGHLARPSHTFSLPESGQRDLSKTTRTYRRCTDDSSEPLRIPLPAPPHLLAIRILDHRDSPKVCGRFIGDPLQDPPRHPSGTPQTSRTYRRCADDLSEPSQDASLGPPTPPRRQNSRPQILIEGVRTTTGDPFQVHCATPHREPIDRRDHRRCVDDSSDPRSGPLFLLSHTISLPESGQPGLIEDDEDLSKMYRRFIRALQDPSPGSPTPSRHRNPRPQGLIEGVRTIYRSSPPRSTLLSLAGSHGLHGPIEDVQTIYRSPLQVPSLGSSRYLSR